MIGLGTTDPFTTFVGSLAFWIGAVTSIIAAYLMVFRIKNLVRSALALTTVLGGVAMMYAILGADFLAISQLVVYIGAIMVLIIFASVFVAITTPWRVRDTILDIPTAESLGGLMLTRYVLPFEIASLLLTVALIGAIVIARED